MSAPSSSSWSPATTSPCSVLLPRRDAFSALQMNIPGRPACPPSSAIASGRAPSPTLAQSWAQRWLFRASHLWSSASCRRASSEPPSMRAPMSGFPLALNRCSPTSHSPTRILTAISPSSLVCATALRFRRHGRSSPACIAPSITATNQLTPGRRARSYPLPRVASHCAIHSGMRSRSYSGGSQRSCL